MEEDDFIPDVLPKKPDPGAMAALGRGLKSGLTLGAAPKLEAGVSKGLSAIAESGPMRWLNQLGRPEALPSEPVSYAQEVAKNQAEEAATREARPYVYGAGQLIGSTPAFAATAPGAAAGAGKWALQGAALGAAQGAGESKHLLGGESMLDPQAALDVGLGAAGGAVGGLAGYGLGKGAAYGLGKLADRKAMDAVGATTIASRRELRSLLNTQGITEPGEFAQMVREGGLAGGFKGLRSVQAAAKAGTEGETAGFKDLIARATKSGKTMGVNDLIEHVDKNAAGVLYGVGATESGQELSNKVVTDLAVQGIANRSGQPFDVVAKQVAANPELLTSTQGNPRFTHEQFQDVLKRITPEMEILRKKMSGRNPTITAEEMGKLKVYNVLRDFQDKGLTEAVGESGRPVRRAIALNRAVQRISADRAEMLEGQKLVGLQSALWGGTIGGTLSALGLPHVGLPVMAAGLLEKSTAPLRANLLTSALSKAQFIPRLIAQHGGAIPMALGRQVGTDVALGFSPETSPEEEDFIPEPKVAKKGK